MDKRDPANSRADIERTDGPEGTERTVIRAGAAGGTMEAPTERQRSTGSQSGKETARDAKETASAAADKVKSKAGDIGDKAGDLASKAGDKLSDTGQRAMQAAASAKDKVEMPGPVLSSVLGALAGSLGGWWLGRSEPDEASGYTADDERHYREHFEAHQRPGVGYDEARTAYLLGHVAARNPEYDGRDFKDVEPDLRQGFRGEYDARWDVIRDYAKHAYERRSGGAIPAVLGALAGALGGWWAASSHDTASKMPEEEESAYREHFASSPRRSVGVTYEIVRPYYAIGYIAARNPSYQGRRFEEIEPELRRGFAGEDASRYDTHREYARHAYERGKGGGATSR